MIRVAIRRVKPKRIRSFVAQGQRGQAQALARDGGPDAWNAWRQDTDLFGDHVRIRINLSESDLSGRDFRGYKLANVSWYKTDLNNANLSKTDCSHSDFHLSQLIEADLRGVNFRHSRLSRAYLRGADLTAADLSDTDLRRASLTGAILRRTNLRGVDLSATRGLIQEQIDQAIGDAHTRLPPHLSRPDVWTIYSEDDDGDLIEEDNYRSLPATVEVSIQYGKLQLTTSPGDAFITSSVDPDILREELISNLNEIIPRIGNLGQLSKSFNSYKESITNKDSDIIIIGLRGLTVESVFTSMVNTENASQDFELLSDIIGSIRAVLIQHYLFVSQSHKWKAFVEKANQSPYRREHKDLARDVGEEIAGKLKQNPKLCDPAVPQAIDLVVSELEISDDSQNLTVFNAFASEENILRSFMAWAVKESRRLKIDIWDEFHKQLAKVIGGGLAILAVGVLTSTAVGTLATLFPHRFGWLVHVVELLKATKPD